MRRPQFTVRGQMIAVAVGTLLAYGAWLVILHRQYAAEARRHDAQLTKTVLALAKYEPEALRTNVPGSVLADDAVYRRLKWIVEFRTALKDRAERGARYPWLPLPPKPDLTPPE